LTANVLIEYIMINCYQEVKMQNIGTLLKLARTAQGLTQRDLARKAGLSQTAIARIESGRISKPGYKICTSLAKALGQSPELFLDAQQMRKEKQKETIASTLVRCGVDEKAAWLIVKSLRSDTKGKVAKALEKTKKKKGLKDE